MLSDTIFYFVSSLIILVGLPLTLAVKDASQKYREYQQESEERLQRRIRESLDSADRLYTYTKERKPEPRVESEPETRKALNCPNCGAPISEGERCEYCGTYFEWK